MNEIAIEERSKRLKLCCSVSQPEEAPYVTVYTDSDLTLAVGGGGGYYAYGPYGGIGIGGVILIILIVLLLSGRLR
jgi:hypothetical protein